MFLAFVVLISISLSFALSSDSYIAAIVEHQTYPGVVGESPESILKVNLDTFGKHITLAKSQNAQIIIFPEFGLTALPDSSTMTRADLYPYATKIPDSSQSVIPCIDPQYDSSLILKQVSCAARSNNIVVLINTIDWVDCDSSIDSNCPSDGHYQFNTDVIFDESGKIVSKYHKSHEWPPFIGPYDQSPVISHVNYTASFGVNFGLFICYDIMFPDPARTLTQPPYSIQHFLYAVAQGQAGFLTTMPDWSKATQSVLLASNLGAGPTKGSGDCSGGLLNGSVIPSQKFPLSSEKGSYLGNENVLIMTVPIHF